MTSKITKPMLAGTLEDMSLIEFPVGCSPKLDGIRCLMIGGKALSRKFKPIPNNFIRNTLEKLYPDGFDGEIILEGKTFNEIQSVVMTEEGEPDFKYLVFDYVKESIDDGYFTRQQILDDWFTSKASDMAREYASQLKVQLIDNTADLLALEKEYLAQGHEGLMLRSTDGPYKCGRSTAIEGYLLKLKRFTDAEGVIVGFVERLHNANPAEKDAFGRTKRSSHKANLIPRGDLGAFKVKIAAGEFVLGTGMDDNLRKEVWNNQDKYLGTYVKFKYQESGAKNLPRFPVFLGFRHVDDMSE